MIRINCNVTELLEGVLNYVKVDVLMFYSRASRKEWVHKVHR